MVTVKSARLRLSALLMILAIIGIAAFQGYWIRKLYSEGWVELKKETDIAFRDVVYKLQLQQIRKDTFFQRHDLPPNLFLFNLLDSIRSKRFLDSVTTPNHLPAGKMEISFRARFDSNGEGNDSGIKRAMSIEDIRPGQDTVTLPVIRYYSSGGPPEPALSIAQIDSAYKKELLRSQITVSFTIKRIQGKADELDRPTPPDRLETDFLFVGLSKAYAYQASFANPASYILSRIKWPILMSLLLLAFTSAAFVFLYRNLRQQERLAVFKNEFISNMTHELKTPISTIKVAVEALRHFDALDDPKRTREYLDISALELQRLSMLVDKVLKLSQFENKEIELRPTLFDLHELAAEVIAGMKLQFENAGAVVQLSGAGSGFRVKADRAHLSSVLSNLLDNALKYSKENPVINLDVFRQAEAVGLAVSDNGIGIPAAYIDRIFDKFFRAPSGDHHNIKGYGLGLNYVQYIIHWHRGSIEVDSKEGRGSTFTIKLPAA